MTNKYLIDTCIWRDYYENRSDKFRPLGDWALAFLNKAMEECSIIIYSNFIIKELRNDYTEEEIENILNIVKEYPLLKRINVENKHIKQASILSRKRGIPFGDAIQVIVARDLNATVITRDNHFEKVQDVATSKKPEELI